MGLSVRDLALECVSHLGEENDLDGTMPAGSLTALANCINAALEEMRSEAQSLFRQTLGIQWTPATTGTVNVTAGEAQLTLGTLTAPDDGCTVMVAGDASFNELRAEPTEDGSYLLLHPYSGTTGTVNCTAYGDSVQLDAAVDRVLGAMLLHERRPLQILSSREQWMDWQSLSGRRDYGFHSLIQTLRRQPGDPRAVWVESFLDPEGGAILYRARCAPLPDSTYRATLEVLAAVRQIQQEDWADGAEVFLPVPGGRDYSILRPIVLQKWSGTPWFKNAESRQEIAAQYMRAMDQLRAFKANAAAPIRTRVMP